MISFKWQSSFRDHLIRDEKDYQNHLEYIKNQPLKHQLAERKWYWIVRNNKDPHEVRVGLRVGGFIYSFVRGYQRLDKDRDRSTGF